MQGTLHGVLMCVGYVLIWDIKSQRDSGADNWIKLK